MLYKVGLRYLLRKPIQSIFCIFGVALGVAVVIAIDLANTSASRAFTLSTATVAGKATHQVVGGVNGLSQDVYTRIKVDLGVVNAAPVVAGYVTAIELGQQPVRVLGIDVFAEPPFRSYLGGTSSQSGIVNLSELLTSPTALLVGELTAQRYGLTIGSPVTLRLGDQRVSVRLAGILTSKDERSQNALDNLGIMDISAAQELFRMQGKLSYIDLIADERTAEGQNTLAQIRAVLPSDARIIKPQTRSQSVESLTDAFELNLTALSLLALVVGMFLIYNTITFSVVQRRTLFGILRCLGVTRAEMIRLVLVESAILGAIGSLFGVLFGIVLGRGAVTLVTQTINDLYYVVNVRDVGVESATVFKGVVLGIGAAILAALVPALEASSIPPVSVLKRSNVEQRMRKVLPFVAIFGAVLAMIGTGMLLLSKELVINLGGIFGVVIGLALLTPLVTWWLMKISKPIAGKLLGVVGKLALGTIANSISRTAIAIASLMIAVSVIIGLQSMINSFRLTVETWLDATLIADVYVSAPANGVNNSNNNLADDLPDLFRASSGVSAVTTLRRLPVEFTTEDDKQRWNDATLLLVQADTDRQAAKFVWTESSAAEIWGNMMSNDEVQMSEPLANRYGIDREHNMIVMRTQQGDRLFKVVGVYFDYAADQGAILMRRELFGRYWNDQSITALAVYLTPELHARGREVVDELRSKFVGRELVITANRDLRSNALAVFDRTFAITGALNLLATIVAFIGVLSSLMALQIERTRELGILRANGMTQPQLWKMTLVETGLMGGLAGLFSWPTGYLLALILVNIINKRSFGWTIPLSLQWETFLQALAVAVASAILASIYPMIRMGRLQIASALRQE